MNGYTTHAARNNRDILVNLEVWTVHPLPCAGTWECEKALLERSRAGPHTDGPGGSVLSVNQSTGNATRIGDARDSWPAGVEVDLRPDHGRSSMIDGARENLHSTVRLLTSPLKMERRGLFKRCGSDQSRGNSVDSSLHRPTISAVRGAKNHAAVGFDMECSQVGRQLNAIRG